MLSGKKVAARYTVLKIARNMSVGQALSVLGLDSSTTAREVKQVYRALALANHPDRGGDLRKMQEINAAHMVVTKALDRGALGGAAHAPKVVPGELYRSLMRIFRRLESGNVVEITYAARSSSSPDKRRKFVVASRGEAGLGLRTQGGVAEGAADSVYVYPARRTSNSQMGSLKDYGDTLYFQATMLQQIQPVRALKIVGQV